MQIKKFEANNMKEALCRIKNEFGPEAVILSVRKIETNKNNFIFYKNYGVEVTAATDEKISDKNLNYKNANSNTYQNVKNNRNALNPFSRKKRNFTNFKQEDRKDNSTGVSPRFSYGEKNKDAKELYASYHQMIDQGVDIHIASELIKEASKFGLSDPCLYKIGFKSCLIQVLEQKGISANRVKINKNTSNVIVAVGPTGVGKTTTIAKLAAAAKSGPKNRQVALITTDDNRIGAIEQLKVYSKIIGVPLKTAVTKEDINTALDKFAEFDLIFIDTPGMNPKNNTQINSIMNVFSGIEHAEYHLVLSAATNDNTLRDVIERYRKLNVKGLIFTKLDECITYGSVLNQLYRSKTPVTYFTNGQKVPEDIEIATLEKLTDLIIDEVNKKKYLSGPPEILADNIIRFENIIHGNSKNIVDTGYKYAECPDDIRFSLKTNNM